MTQIEIHTMTIADYDAVYDFWLHTPGMGLNAADDSREGIAKFLARNPTSCFIAKDGAALIGAILAGHDGRRGFLYHLAVHPDYRRRGIARQLVDAAVGALEREGIHKAALVVFARNEDGNAFWEKIGFSVRGDLIYRNKPIRETRRIDT